MILMLVVNLIIMNNFSIIQFLLQSILFLVIQQDIIADTSNCNTLKLKPTEKLVVSILDSDNRQGYDNWDAMCAAVMKFPKGLVSLEYLPGALATGTVDNIKCGPDDCKNDQFQGCMARSKNYNSCYDDMVTDYPSMLKCYCTHDSNKFLLDNAALRAAWKIPEDVNFIPALAMNKVYDPCAKFKTTEEFQEYLCQIYQKQVGSC